MELSSAQVQEHLEYLRRGDQADQEGYLLRWKALSELFKGPSQIWLDGFGSSKEEFRKFRTVASKIQAKNWLLQLRTCESQADHDRLLGSIRNALSTSENLSLEDLGSSHEELAQIKIKLQKMKCCQWLKMLRQGAPESLSLLNSLLQKLQMEKLTLADIGTSEKEIKEFQNGAYITKMRRHVAYFRKRIDVFENYLIYLQEKLAEKELALVDIGITPKDVAEYRLKAVQQFTSQYLWFLRRGTISYGRYLFYLRQEIKRRGFSLDDIGISEKEIEKLKLQSARSAAQKWLEYLRQGYDYSLCYRFLKRELANGKLTLADLGVCKQELREIKNSKISA